MKVTCALVATALAGSAAADSFSAFKGLGWNEQLNDNNWALSRFNDGWVGNPVTVLGQPLEVQCEAVGNPKAKAGDPKCNSRVNSGDVAKSIEKTCRFVADNSKDGFPDPKTVPALGWSRTETTGVSRVSLIGIKSNVTFEFCQAAFNAISDTCIKKIENTADPSKNPLNMAGFLLTDEKNGARLEFNIASTRCLRRGNPKAECLNQYGGIADTNFKSPWCESWQIAKN
ncbi:MAG: hypothetical protein M1825_006067 [Sarcosagium campestre]|nr:MAG: hypothetical protein M1825_006067 [Sarcosagium campestre]